MREMTKEELELEIDILSDNINVLIGLGHEASEPRKKLAEYRSQLRSLSYAEDSAPAQQKSIKR
jgi:hypothetical protein